MMGETFTILPEPEEAVTEQAEHVHEDHVPPEILNRYQALKEEKAAALAHWEALSAKNIQEHGAKLVQCNATDARLVHWVDTYGAGEESVRALFDPGTSDEDMQLAYEQAVERTDTLQSAERDLAIAEAYDLLTTGRGRIGDDLDGFTWESVGAAYAILHSTSDEEARRSHIDTMRLNAEQKIAEINEIRATNSTILQAVRDMAYTEKTYGIS